MLYTVGLFAIFWLEPVIPYVFFFLSYVREHQHWYAGSSVFFFFILIPTCGNVSIVMLDRPSFFFFELVILPQNVEAVGHPAQLGAGPKWPGYW